MACNFWQCSHYLEWILDIQDVIKHRAMDLKILGSEEEYQKVMIFFADVIQAFGKGVEVRQQVIATATVYFRRFYSRTSLQSIDPWLMAPSCLFLASKVEEFGVLAPKSLINICIKVVSSQFSKYFKDCVYPYRQPDLWECEFILMEAMDCSLIVFHPYRPLVQLCEDLRPHLLGTTDALLERSWRIVNDSLRTDLCLHYPPYLIALGCLQLALISLEKNPPTDGRNGGDKNSNAYSAYSSSYQISHQRTISPLAVAEHWFSDLNVDMEKVLEVSRQMLALYDLWRFDVESEMPILLHKLPRPNIQSQQPPQQQQQSNNGDDHIRGGGSSMNNRQQHPHVSQSGVGHMGL